jgi:hypothetical protein
MEGKKLVEPAAVSSEEEDEVYFLDQEYSSFYDDKVWTNCINTECIDVVVHA